MGKRRLTPQERQDIKRVQKATSREVRARRERLQGILKLAKASKIPVTAAEERLLEKIRAELKAGRQPYRRRK